MLPFPNLRFFIPMFMSLWITTNAFAWGAIGHRIVVEYGTTLADPKALTNCRITAPQLIEHTNDPDKIWRQQRFRHPHENEMHFFHVDRQPIDWRSRSTPADPKQGRLVYRIIEWQVEAKKLRASGDWNALAETLYGLSHYLGDLTQPLHLHHDYDGEEAGLPDLHAQFETKMLGRFEHEIRASVRSRLADEKIPALWQRQSFKELIFASATQSHAKTSRLFSGARQSFFVPKVSRRRKKTRNPEPRFEKKALLQSTGALAADQLALGARLWAFTLNLVCR